MPTTRHDFSLTQLWQILVFGEGLEESKLEINSFHCCTAIQLHGIWPSYRSTLHHGFHAFPSNCQSEQINKPRYPLTASNSETDATSCSSFLQSLEQVCSFISTTINSSLGLSILFKNPHHRSSGGFKRSVTQRVRSSPIQTNEQTLVHTSRLSLCRLACIKDGVWFSPWPNLQSLTFLSEFHHQVSSVTIQNPFSSVGWHYRCMSQTC